MVGDNGRRQWKRQAGTRAESTQVRLRTSFHCLISDQRCKGILTVAAKTWVPFVCTCPSEHRQQSPARLRVSVKGADTTRAVMAETVEGPLLTVSAAKSQITCSE